jgi:hypothetical protein
MTFFCVATFFKGIDFIRACKAAGNTVYVLTKKSLEHDPWPRESIDEMFYVEHDNNTPENLALVVEGLAYVMRSRKIDRIVSLDDFDVEKGAYLREHFRISGMGQTTARYFRDKLAMRVRAAEAGINVPAFTALFNDQEIHEYTQRVSAPWLVKPRMEASAIGIKKVHTAEELWNVLHALGDNRHNYLLEQFKPGDVYHADSLTFDGKVLFCRVSQYLNTPFEVAHGGGIFRSMTVEYGGKDDKELQKRNAAVMKAFGMQYSASHTEFIRCYDDDQYYFLETSSRVGGANLAEMVEISSGINLWAEWARIEDAVAKNIAYQLPSVSKKHAGIVVSLSRFQHPDDSTFDDSEIQWRMRKDYHIGMILQADNQKRILELLHGYAEHIARDFHASAPPKETAMS